MFNYEWILPFMKISFLYYLFLGGAGAQASDCKRDGREFDFHSEKWILLPRKLYGNGAERCLYLWLSLEYFSSTNPMCRKLVRKWRTCLETRFPLPTLHIFIYIKKAKKTYHNLFNISYLCPYIFYWPSYNRRKLNSVSVVILV